jgi:hypothetical protein
LNAYLHLSTLGRIFCLLPYLPLWQEEKMEMILEESRHLPQPSPMLSLFFPPTLLQPSEGGWRMRLSSVRQGEGPEGRKGSWLMVERSCTEEQTPPCPAIHPHPMFESTFDKDFSSQLYTKVS